MSKKLKLFLIIKKKAHKSHTVDHTKMEVLGFIERNDWE